MMKCGFKPGKYNPCTFYHKQRDLRTLVHGDDFVTSGQREGCGWFKKQLETRFSIKTRILGMREDEVKEERILNRVIRVTSQGWEMEADQRHVDIMIEQLNLKEAKGVSSPGEGVKRWEKKITASYWKAQKPDITGNWRPELIILLSIGLTSSTPLRTYAEACVTRAGVISRI